MSRLVVAGLLLAGVADAFQAGAPIGALRGARVAASPMMRTPVQEKKGEHALDCRGHFFPSQRARSVPVAFALS